MNLTYQGSAHYQQPPQGYYPTQQQYPQQQTQSYGQQQFPQQSYGQPMSPSIQLGPNTPNSSFIMKPASSGSFHNMPQQDPALVSSQPSVLEFKNLYPNMLNDKLVKNTFWTSGGNLLIKIFIFIVNKVILMGLGEALMINYITRRQVKKMRIGNRMLSYKSRGNFKMALLCIVNWILNIFTCGLFYALGYSHQMYLSQLDARIHWGKPAKVSKKKNQHVKEAVCWEPIGNGLGEFKIFSVYLGFWNEAMFIFLVILNISSFGLLSPLLYKIYFPKYFEKVELGKGGRFAIIHPKMIPSINKCQKEI